jgi:putative redox protein
MDKASVRLRAGLQAEITAGEHTWFADEPLEDGGTDTGANPPQQLLGALGACMAMTARHYADRKGWPLEGVDVALEMERVRGTDHPTYRGEAEFVHNIIERITFYGPLDEAQKTRLLEISRKCPVRRVLMFPTVFMEQVVEAE